MADVLRLRGREGVAEFDLDPEREEVAEGEALLGLGTFLTRESRTDAAGCCWFAAEVAAPDVEFPVSDLSAAGEGSRLLAAEEAILLLVEVGWDPLLDRSDMDGCCMFRLVI